MNKEKKKNETISVLQPEPTKTDQPETELTAEQKRRKLDLARTRAVINSMSRAQKERYQAYRFSTFKSRKNHIKSIMTRAMGNDQISINDSILIFICGVAKVFVGELIEEALDVAGYDQNQNPPLTPNEIREAYRRMQYHKKLSPARFLSRNKKFKR
eukprot:c18834_g1_i1.p1 GENE.c18834_g1_i1~~c18834_g1_i1.p1  ORF type:complete len:157 (+),score=57.37 c18834_g1_i1:1-471(+)